jgi:hypothetical protein
MKTIMLKKTNQNYYSILKLIVIMLFTITTVSCSKSDDICEETNLCQNKISQEIKDLIYFGGEENAPIVLLNVQGGPSTTLSTFEVDSFFDGNLNTTDILMANVNQAQILNPSILEGNDITLDQAVNINTQSVEILYKVIKYFKDQGRTVYVLGVSYGVFLVQDLIAKKGIDVADKYVVVSGRLDMNEVLWQGLAEGKEGGFVNGVTPMLDATPHPDVVERNGLRLQAGFGKNRYTQLFNAINNLSNLTYVFGTIDEAVGSLTAEEFVFLESKKANIISGPYNHTDTYYRLVLQALNDAFGIVPN